MRSILHRSSNEIRADAGGLLGGSPPQAPLYYYFHRIAGQKATLKLRFSLLMLPPLGVENRAVAFQDRGPPGPYPSVVALGGVGERAPPLTLFSLSFPPSPWGEVGRKREYVLYNRAQPCYIVISC